MRRFLVFLMLVACALVVPAPPTANAAVDPEITVTLEQDQTTSRVGSTLGLTAEVEVLVGAKELRWGVWYVEFTGTAGGGWSSGAIATDDGRARYDRPAGRADTAGPETITATLVSEGCSGISDSVEHIWYDEALALTLNVAGAAQDPDENSPGPLPRYSVVIGNNVTVTARLTRNGSAVVAPNLRITRGAEEVPMENDGNGAANATWSRQIRQVETVTVTEVGAVGGVVERIEINWYESVINRQPRAGEAPDKPAVPGKPEPGVRLRAAAVGPRPAIEVDLRRSLTGQEGPVGTEISWSAKVVLTAENEDEISIPGIEVTFSESGGRWSDTADTTADGVATLPPIISDTARTDTVTARVAFDGCGTFVSVPVVFEWWEPVLTLTPLDATSEAGEEFGLQAKFAQSNGPAIPFARLGLTSHSTQCDLGDVLGVGYTNEDGVVTIPVRRDTPTTDLITVRENPEPLGRARAAAALASATTTHTWTAADPPNLAVDLQQDAPDGRAGSSVTVTATVSEPPTGASPGPRAGVPVTFSGFDGPDVTRDTDPEGRAQYTYSKATASTDNIVATAPYGCSSVSDALDHVWWEPVLTLTPLDATSEAGQYFELEARLTRSIGGPIDDIYLGLVAHSTQCTLVDLTDDELTDVDGLAVFRLRRDTPTTDAITVVESPPLGRVQVAAAVASATTTHTWTRAVAPNRVVDLQQDAADGRVGSAVTVIATVSVPPSSGETPGPQAGVPVTFSGFDGPDVTRDTDAEGRAQYTYGKSTASSDHIVATVPYGCSTVSDAIDHEWWVPTLTLTPRDTTTPAGRDVDFTAGLVHSAANAPVADQELTFTLHSGSCVLPDETRTVRTGPNGRATVPFSRPVPSRDTVTVSESAPGIVSPQSDLTGHVWGRPAQPPIELRLQQTSDNSRIGAQTTLTARVTITDADVPKPKTVQFVVDGKIISPIEIDDGVAWYTYTRTTAGTDRVTATTAYGCDVVRSNELDHRWWRPELRLSPAAGTSTVGASATLTATLSEGTRVVPGQRVRITVRDDAAALPDRSFTVRTNAQGRATVPLRRATPGLDRITAVELAQPNPASADARHTWTAAPDTRRLTLVATPAGGETEVGREHTVVAVTEFGGEPQDGVAVTFTADKPDEGQRAGTDVSGQLGRTSLTYTRAEPGTDRIVVTATFQNQTVTQTVSQEWIEKAGQPDLTLGPDGTSSPVGEEFTATAVVEQDGEPQSGVAVEFTSEMAGETQTDSVVTDADGQAQFNYVQDVAGEDRVTATASVDDESVEAEITHTWTDDEGSTVEPKSPPTVTPRSLTARPGGDLAVSGAGCSPDETVVIFISGEEVGRTTADGDGNYQFRGPVPKLPLGPHVIRATCGSVTTNSSIDLNLPQNGASAAASGATSGTVLLFFVLLANALMNGVRGRFD